MKEKKGGNKKDKSSILDHLIARQRARNSQTLIKVKKKTRIY